MTVKITKLKVTRTARNDRKIDLGGKDTILLADGLIKIRVNRVQGAQVHLTIEAPRDIDIVRAELLEQPKATAIFEPMRASLPASELADDDNAWYDDSRDEPERW